MSREISRTPAGDHRMRAEPVESVPAPFDKLGHIPQLAVCWFHASQDCVRHGVRLRLGQPVASLQFDDLIWTDDVVCRQLDGTSGESEVMPAPDVGGRHLDQPDAALAWRAACRGTS